MKRITLLSATLLLCIGAAAQTPKNVKYSFTEASDLTLTGKLMPGTPNAYSRVDTLVYKGFTQGENYQVRLGAGMAVAFKTNSTVITVLTEYSPEGNKYETSSTTCTSYRGYDLYIKKDGKWLYAASGNARRTKPNENVLLIKDMDGSEHECLMYLPEYAEVYSVKVGIQDDAKIEALENPFRHRIVVHGSSFTQGVSTSRSGMAYPSQLGRRTGLQMINFGCAGNCKMQSYFCDVLCDVEADAFIFDAFSNPSAEIIEERLVGFIDRLIEAHPGTPLIFQETIYRERRNFNVENEKFEGAKNVMARKLFAQMKSTKEGKQKYKDVYLITTCATTPEHDTSVDGTHPDDHGYYLWSKSIEKQVVKILAKYGIR
ncbi:MAG: SGNH/GDSL hydrolase family protein [Bacteroidales bacterium]|nr:SGNH/GDSL hydrolase family protein [Bacteroidales bacterium]